MYVCAIVSVCERLLECACVCAVLTPAPPQVAALVPEHEDALVWAVQAVVCCGERGEHPAPGPHSAGQGPGPCAVRIHSVLKPSPPLSKWDVTQCHSLQQCHWDTTHFISRWLELEISVMVTNCCLRKSHNYFSLESWFEFI